MRSYLSVGTLFICTLALINTALFPTSALVGCIKLNANANHVSNSLESGHIPLHELEINSAAFLNLWAQHKSQYDLEFEHKAEEQMRIEIFHKNQLFIHQHNQRNLSYTLKSNQFAHLTRDEYLKLSKTPNKLKFENLMSSTPLSNDSAKKSDQEKLYYEPIDWRLENIVSPVKDQKFCGSCWTFSVTGSVEAALAKETGEMVLLSEQQMVDCAGEFFNEGCNGGYNDLAMSYIIKYGIETEDDYKYEAEDLSCRYDKSKTLYHISDFVKMGPGEDNLDKALKEVGPVSISIDASLDTFRFYNNGIYYDPACSSYDLDHAVLAVGLDYDQYNNSYYIVKNSWGESWGDNGYIKMLRDGNNNCGVASEPVYPIV